MGIVRDLYMARKIGAGLKLPAPTVGSLIKRLLLAKILYSDAKKTETGVLIHILDALAEPAIAAVVNIAPVQNLNGYTRPWPAGGGVNLFPDALPADTIIAKIATVNDQPVIQSATNARVFSIPCEQNTDYAFQHTTGTGGIIVAFSEKAPEIGDVLNNRKVLMNLGFWTTNSGSNTYIIVSVTTEADFATLVSDGEMMVFKGSSALDDYYPYSNICPISGITGLSVYVSPTNDVDDATTYAVDWTSPAGTVYGGTIDVVTGVLTVDRAYVDMGSLTWTPNAKDYMNFYSTGLQNVVKRPPSADTGHLYVVCSTYASVPALARDDCYIYVHPSGQIRVKDTANASLTGAQFKTLMSGVQLVYLLATPVTHQLTAQEVQMLLGENYIWSSSGDSMSVTYLADGNATPLESLNLMLGNRYSNPGTVEDVSDREALEILLGR